MSKWIRKAHEVEAEQFKGDPIMGYPMFTNDKGEKFLYVDDVDDDRVAYVSTGNWIVRDGRDFLCYTDEGFHKRFSPVGTAEDRPVHAGPEAVLAKYWDTPEENEAWDDLEDHIYG